MTYDETTLIDRLRGGDERALEQLVASHWDGVLRYAHGFLGDWDRAEDVAQTAFVRLWAHRERWSAPSAAALVFRIARNAALDVLKSSASRKRSELPDRLASVESSDRALEEGELERAAGAAVSALAPRRREVFKLAREEALSYAEIAEVMGVSPQTVANNMSLALADLRVALRPFLSSATGSSGTDQRDAQGRPSEANP